MKKRILKVALSLLVLGVFILTSCKKEEEFDSSIKTKTAILDYQGAYAVDGCGYFFEIDSKEYKPDNEGLIDSSFQLASKTTVTIEFQYLQNAVRSNCFDSRNQVVTEGIHLISIKK